MEKQCWRKKSFLLELIFPKPLIETGKSKGKCPRPMRMCKTTLGSTKKYIKKLIN